MTDIDPDVNASSRWVQRMILICTLIGVLILLIGCTYTGRNDPNIQFWDQPHKEFTQSPRQIYFSNTKNVGDNWVSRFMCIA